MSITCNVSIDKCGGFYEDGKLFPKAKWASIVNHYQKELEAHGKCVIPRLAEQAKVSYTTANKAIEYSDVMVFVLHHPWVMKNTAWAL